MNVGMISTTTLFALASVLAAPASAANLSDLKVIQSAAQTGKWTIASTGSPQGMNLPSSTETVCATREEILQNFNHALALGPGGESQQCPTQLSTNTSSLGVATMTCPATKLVMGEKTINVPGMTLSVEVKKTGTNQWTSRVASMNMTGTYTFHGEASADCIKTR